MTDRTKLLGLGMICGTVIATATLTTTAGPGQAIQAAAAVAVAATANTTPTIDPALLQEPWDVVYWDPANGTQVVLSGPVFVEAVILGYEDNSVLQLADGSNARVFEGTSLGTDRIDLGVVLDGLRVQQYGLPFTVLYRCIDPSICTADMTTTGATIDGQPGYGTPDGQIDLDDLGFFLNLWTQAGA